MRKLTHSKYLRIKNCNSEKLQIAVFSTYCFILRLRKYNILTQIIGGRALIRSELYGKDDAYEFIRGVYDNPDHSVIDCSNSKCENKK